MCSSWDNDNNRHHNNNRRVINADQVIIRANRVFVMGAEDENRNHCRRGNVAGAEDHNRHRCRRRCCWF
ncbi:hypothetical protein [Cytobacillus praedii]|uniref:hypothetical protein n=1 Tax=Cytobacillus praedii TaxID=1742358 RepID=UPI002E24BD2E|nr:hypothetical protein [Cytobacillus praedii]